MKLLIKKITCVILILCSYCSYGEAKIQLPSILGNGMVLQQKSEVKLWGKATPNKKVVVYTSWNAQQQEVDSNQKGGLVSGCHNSRSWRAIYYSHFRW